jgi:hypothetical protein
VPLARGDSRPADCRVQRAMTPEIRHLTALFPRSMLVIPHVAQFPGHGTRCFSQLRRIGNRQGSCVLRPGVARGARGEQRVGKKQMNTTLKWMAGALGLAAGAYAGYVGVTWLRYGRPAHARAEDLDPLLDRFMPVYDIVERHHVRVAAPADVTFSAACDIDMQRSPVIRAIFRAREVILGSEPDTAARPHELLAWAKSLGWGVLAETPDREIVMGAVTQPWKANVAFRPVSPDAFTTFNEPGFVKIAWTLRADATSTPESVFRTETRAVATDDTARAKFRRYWSFLSPGIIVIRWTMLQPLKAEAERRAAVRRSADLERVAQVAAESVAR